MLLGSRLRSLPRVKGTTQKVHILSQPRVMDTKAVTPLDCKRTGRISPYVSSLERITLTASRPSSTSLTKLGRSLYASGPATRSTIFSSSKNFDFKRSAIQPNTPTFRFGLLFLTLLNCSNRFRTVCSAFSRIEQVLTRTKSACLRSFVVEYPASARIEATISLSEKFI